MGSWRLRYESVCCSDDLRTYRDPSRPVLGARVGRGRASILTPRSHSNHGMRAGTHPAVWNGRGVEEWWPAARRTRVPKMVER